MPFLLVHPQPNRFSTFEEPLGAQVRTWLHEDLDIPRDTHVLPALPANLSPYQGILNCTKSPSLIAPYVYLTNSIPTVNIYPPQDSLDQFDKSIDNDDEDEEESNKDVEPTRRINQMFWTEQAWLKLIKGYVKQPYSQFFLYPPADAVIRQLSSISNAELTLDIEAVGDVLSCIGFKINSGPVYVVPIYRYDGTLAHTHTTTFALWHAFAKAFSRNKLILHNASFDITYLAHYYRLPFTFNIYDTMVGAHRTYPQAEKSLAHCTGLYTNFPYHKSEYVIPRSERQERQLFEYNAKDVDVTYAIYKAQQQRAANDAGLAASIAQGNASILPYIINSLFGLRVNFARQHAEIAALERTASAMLKIARCLINDHDFNPGSAHQCADFFFNTLNYEPYNYSETTHKPTCNRKDLYRLQLKYNNPLIPVIIKYREAAKALSMLRPNFYTPPFIT